MLDVKLKIRPGHNDGRDWMAPSPLRMLFWNVTRACNFACPICFTGGGQPEPDELTTAEAKAMLRGAKAAGVGDIIISGGEPFMRDDLLELLAFMAEEGIGARIASNGTLLTDQMLKRLRRETLARSFMISLDTLDPALFAEMHGTGAEMHAAALRALGSIRDNGFHTTVSARVTPRTLPGLPALVERAAEEGWATVSLQCLARAGRTEDVWPPGTDGLALLEPVFEHFLSLPSHWLIENYAPWARYHPVMRRLEERTHVAHVGCGAGRSFLVIQPAGRVVPCLCLDVPEACVGSVREHDLAEMFQGSQVCRMMRRPREHGICADCEEVDACGGGCRASAFALTGRLDGIDQSCWLRRTRLATGAGADACR